MAENPELVPQPEPVAPTTPEPVTPTTPAPAEPVVFTEREKQYYARIKKLEGELAVKGPQEPVTPTPSLPADKPVEVQFDTLAAFVEATRDLKTAELSELRSEAKNLGVDPMKYIASKAGQAHLAEVRRTATSTEAVPGPSNRTRMYNGKPVDTILTDPAATKADKQSAWEAKIGKGNRGANSAQ